jgi:hypothetical protein
MIVHGSFQPQSDGRSNGHKPTRQDVARRTTDDAPRAEAAPDIPPGTREWWERHWTESLEALKRYLEEREGI